MTTFIGRIQLSEDGVRKVLRDLGLTEKEVDIYIFLAKHGAIKGGEISRRTKTHKGLVYRILSSLQSKGLVTATLEVPARFASVNFEEIIDSRIRSKQEDARQLEGARNDLLSYWKGISQTLSEQALEKFTVIEGERRIYTKVSQMIKETKNQLSAVSTVKDLLRAERFGLFNAIKAHPARSKIRFRFLTDLSNQNLEAVKRLLNEMPKSKFNLKGRNPQLGLQLAPRMVIRDNEEIIFFITPRRNESTIGQDETCLWTNSKELVHAFVAVFDDLWRDSIDIGKKILELQIGKQTPKTYVINDATIAKRTYEETINSAKQEILMLTSAQDLLEQTKNMTLIRKLVERGVAIKIMAPITSQNLEAALKLLKYCTVRHASASHLATTIIDGQHLFQFKTSVSNRGDLESMTDFEDTFYTSDQGYVGKIRILLNNIWMNAPTPSKVSLEETLGSKPLAPGGSPTSASIRTIKKEQWYGAVYVTIDKKPLGTEKELLRKVTEYEKDPSRTVAYGSTGQVIVRPPANFSCPNIMIDCWHIRRGTFGKSNTLIVSLWLNTPEGYMFVPAAVVETTANPQLIEFYRGLFAGTPAGKNVIHVTDKELQVWRKGDGLFAGWTIQIPLDPLPRHLPPSCLLFERIGKARTQTYTTPLMPSGYTGTCEYTGFDAFVTFISPTWKYAGPATEAVFGMNVIMTSIAPQKQIN